MARLAAARYETAVTIPSSVISKGQVIHTLSHRMQLLSKCVSFPALSREGDRDNLYHKGRTRTMH